MPVSAQDLRDRLDSFDWDAWAEEMRVAIERPIRTIAITSANREAKSYGWEFDAHAPFVEEHFTSYLAERVTGLTETTKDGLMRLLQREIAGDATPAELRAAITDTFILSPARAEMIERTERAIALNHGQALAYVQNSIEYVEISDGDDDDECADADGAIWTVDQYLEEPLAHPNCVRSASPVLTNEAEEE